MENDVNLPRSMAVDLGQVRIGLALSDRSRILATPWGTIQRKKADSETISELLHIASENDVGEIVVGIPKSLSEQQTIAAKSAEDFIGKLKESTSVAVIGFDERFTSVLASKKLRELGHDSRSLKSLVDASAAAEILQEYLDQRAR